MADVTDATFMTDVIERSATVPVVVDLWAPWCGPCTSLGPILEKVIGETQGLVELAKVNVDENPEISAAFKVQSIPAVYAMKDGQVVDGFMGAQGEPQVVEFVQRLLDGSVAVADVDQDGAVDGEDENTQTVAVDATAPESTPQAAPQMSEPGAPGAVSEPTPVEPVVVSAEEGAAIEAELVELLITVKSDDEARERYVALLEQLGPDDPRTNTYRRRLATALF